MLNFILWPVFFVIAEVLGCTVPHWKALRYGKNGSRELSCGSTSSICQGILRIDNLLNKRVFVKTQSFRTVYFLSNFLHVKTQKFWANSNNPIVLKESVWRAFRLSWIKWSNFVHAQKWKFWAYIKCFKKVCRRSSQAKLQMLNIVHAWTTKVLSISPWMNCFKRENVRFSHRKIPWLSNFI